MKRNNSSLEGIFDEDILRERTELLTEYNQNLARAKFLVSRLAKLKQELRRRRGKQERPFVSDHAIVRYLERIEGLDIEAVRDFILTSIPISEEISEHNSIKTKDFIIKMSKDRKAITTVLTEDMLDEGTN